MKIRGGVPKLCDAEGEGPMLGALVRWVEVGKYRQGEQALQVHFSPPLQYRRRASHHYCTKGVPLAGRSN